MSSNKKEVVAEVRVTSKFTKDSGEQVIITIASLDDAMNNVKVLLTKQKGILKGTSNYVNKVATLKKFLNATVEMTIALIQSGEMETDKYNLLSSNVSFFTRNVTQIVEKGTENLDNELVNEVLVQLHKERAELHAQQMANDPSATLLEKAINPTIAAQIIAEPELVDSTTHTTQFNTEDGGKITIDKFSHTVTAHTPEGDVVKEIEVKGTWRESAINFLRKILNWIMDFYASTKEGAKSAGNKLKGVFGIQSAKDETVNPSTPVPTT